MFVIAVLALFLVVIHGLDSNLPVFKPTSWPSVFHATMKQNRSNHLSLVDLFYDWPAGLNLNIIKSLDEERILYDIEWNNHTSYYVDRAKRSCKTIIFPVGILCPTWLEGAEYVGDENVNGIASRVFTKAEFITYYESINTRLPVRWIFHDSGMQEDVLTFDVGIKSTPSQYQAPSYCFDGSGRKESMGLSQE
jgi:hypothetical protein